MSKTKNGAANSSAIIRALSSFSDKMAKRAGNSLIARLLCGYFAVEKSLFSSFSSELCERKSPVRDALSSLRDGVCRVFSESPLKNRFTEFLKNLLYIRTADVGIYLFSAGLYAVIEYIIIKFAIISRDLELNVLYGGIALIVLSLFFFSGRSLANTIIKRSVLSFIVFDLMGADRSRLKPGDVRSRNASTALLLGMLTGVLAFLVPPLRALLFIFCVIVLCTIFFMPECGVVITLTAAPFLPLREVLILCAATVASYLLKTVRRKRELRFGPIDVAMIVLAALTLFGKLIRVKGTASADSLYLIAIAAYFMCRNLLCKREWLDRALHASSLSAAAVSFFGLLFHFCGTPSQMIAARSLFAGAGGEMSVFFGSSSALACYLLLTSPLLLFFAVSSPQRKAGYYLAYAAAFVSLCLTGRIYAVISCLISVFIVMSMYNRRFVAAAALTAPAIALAAVFLPQSFYRGVFANLYTENALIGSVWQGVFRMIAASPFGGTGIGSFGSVYPKYALPGYTTQTGAKSIYLQLTAEGGPVLTLIFLIVLLFAVSFCVGCLIKCGKNKTATYIYAPLSAIISVMLYGLTENVFSSSVICMLTFAVIGIGAAASELCRREHDYGVAVLNNPEV